MDSTDKLELIHSEKGTQLDPLQLGFTLSSLCLPRINSCCLTTGRLRIRTWSYFLSLINLVSWLRWSLQTKCWTTYCQSGWMCPGIKFMSFPDMQMFVAQCLGLNIEADCHPLTHHIASLLQEKVVLASTTFLRNGTIYAGGLASPEKGSSNIFQSADLR